MQLLTIFGREELIGYETSSRARQTHSDDVVEQSKTISKQNDQILFFFLKIVNCRLGQRQSSRAKGNTFSIGMTLFVQYNGTKHFIHLKQN